jgi:molecular chaperone DnaK
MKSGKQASVKIEQSSGLSKDEIERMRRDAESHADEDRKEVELAEAKNRAENTIHGLEKGIKDQGDKLSASDREPLESSIAKLREAINSRDTEKIKAATADLEQASSAFRASYASQPMQDVPGGEPSTSSNADDDDAIDAEFEVKK